MKCRSCNEEIELRMKKALTANECPYCGGSILDKETMQQFLDLHSVLDSQRFTDNVEYDKKIKEKIVRILMEHMRCVKIKDVGQDDDLIKLNSKPATRTISSAQVTPPATPLVNEQTSMRKEMYNQVQQEQYGSNLEEEIEDIEVEEPISDEDRAAAEGVVFSEGADEITTNRVNDLKTKMVHPKGNNKPITRIA